MKLYLPVGVSVLPEYLSTGFVGLTASVQPDEDMQSKAFPDVLVSHMPVKFEGHVLLEIDEERTVSEKDDTELSRFTGPLPMSRVQKILFPDEEALSNFKATYKMLPDIPLALFNLDVLDVGSFQLVGDSSGFAIPKFRRRKLRCDPSQLAATIVGIRQAFLHSGHLVDNFRSLKIRNPTTMKVCIEVVRSLLSSAGYPESSPTASLTMLDLYCESVASLGAQKKIEPTMLLSCMQKGIGERHSKNQVDDEDYRIVTAVFEKTHQVMMGMDSHSALTDMPELILQRAVCLACIAVDLEAFEAMRRNLTIGTLVESIAHLLVASRLRLNRINGDRWRSTRLDMDRMLEAASSTISQKVFKLEVLRSLPDTSFSCQVEIEVTGKIVNDEKVPAPHQVLLVVSMLRSCGYTPLPGHNDEIKIQFDPSTGEAPVPITLCLRVGPTQAHRENVEISAIWHGGEAHIRKIGTRRKIFEIASQYMVSISEEREKGNLILSRYQLLGTMDKEELNYHVELVALAVGALIENI